jgi:hypothetical protein
VGCRSLRAGKNVLVATQFISILERHGSLKNAGGKDEEIDYFFKRGFGHSKKISVEKRRRSRKKSLRNVATACQRYDYQLEKIKA